jgi:hypothetical protein
MVNENAATRARIETPSLATAGRDISSASGFAAQPHK